MHERPWEDGGIHLDPYCQPGLTSGIECLSCHAALRSLKQPTATQDVPAPATLHKEPVRHSLLDRVILGASDANIRFEDLRTLLRDLGFSERINGSHHIYSKPDVEEILNPQPLGAKAKPYQVKQVRKMILRYKLGARPE